MIIIKFLILFIQFKFLFLVIVEIGKNFSFKNIKKTIQNTIIKIIVCSRRTVRLIRHVRTVKDTITLLVPQNTYSISTLKFVLFAGNKRWHMLSISYNDEEMDFLFFCCFVFLNNFF